MKLQALTEAVPSVHVLDVRLLANKFDILIYSQPIKDMKVMQSLETIDRHKTLLVDWHIIQKSYFFWVLQ